MDALTLISKYMFCKARSLRAVTLDFCSNAMNLRLRFRLCSTHDHYCKSRSALSTCTKDWYSQSGKETQASLVPQERWQVEYFSPSGRGVIPNLPILLPPRSFSTAGVACKSPELRHYCDTLCILGAVCDRLASIANYFHFLQSPAILVQWQATLSASKRR